MYVKFAFVLHFRDFTILDFTILLNLQLIHKSITKDPN